MNLPVTFRKEQILKAGLGFVRERGYHEITCEAVANAAQCSYNTVRRVCGNRVQLAAAIRDYAKSVGDKDMYQQGKRATGSA